MKVILLEEVKGKGGEGDVVEVAHGFAVNYLFPQKLAIEANKGNLRQLEARKHNIEKRELARTTDASTLREALEGKEIIIPAKVGEEGQLFGSITTTMIATAITEQIGAVIDRKKIDLRKTIKVAGQHEVGVVVYREIKATIIVNVVNQDAKPAEAAPAVEEAANEASEVAEPEEAAAEVAAEAAEEAAAEAVEAAE